MKTRYFLKEFFSLMFLLTIPFSCVKHKRVTGYGSSEKTIKLFKFLNSDNIGKNLGENLETTIDGSIISLTVPHDASLKGLKPKIIISDKAKVFPSSGQKVDFKFISDLNIYQKVFKVTAEDGSSQNYKVNITKSSLSKLTFNKDNAVLTSFTISADASKGITSPVTGIISNSDTEATGTILLKFPKSNNNDINLEGLTPIIGIPNGYTVDHTNSIAVSGDITNRVFTLKKIDTDYRRVYTVKVVKGPYIKSFVFATQEGITTPVTGIIDHDANTIKLVVPRDLDLNTTLLTPTIELENGEVSPANSVAQKFSSGIKYTVVTSATDLNPIFTKEYTVTVTKKVSSEAKIINFSIGGARTLYISHPGQYSSYTGTVRDRGEIYIVNQITSPPTDNILTLPVPNIGISDHASIDTSQEKNYDGNEKPRYYYTVTAEDGTKNVYDVRIQIALAISSASGNLGLLFSASEIRRDTKSYTIRMANR
ncbi:hypothetical protein [Ichthyobacterium seriolicida]|uniref:Pkd domain containing protein n=1 Tax=Ichthyobacterium seriolicida TaxID=242600 RepID=A0A1J1E700_9FLAO|nr:hypothetical protein [Ichthyobacterium seriolicida]BAV95118.1 hypothetical protein JBKA6_1105 [Ichthyobacterium seriolicida]